MSKEQERQQITRTTRAEEEAIAFLDSYAAGQPPEKEDYLSRLPEKADRDEFEELVRYAVTVESFPATVITAGKMFGPYRIGEKIGEGGMGSVYRAFDTRLSRHVAIKVLPPERTDNETFQRRLEFESHVLAQLQHPNIVAIHEAGSVDEIRYIVMDYVDGVPLSEVLETLAHSPTPPLTAGDVLAAIARPAATGRPQLFAAGVDYWTAIAQILREIVRALEAAHADGVLHRDIKPSNVMLLGGGIPVVLDFGLAGSSRLDAGTMTERLFGSIPYLAPEQVRDQRIGSDQRTDIYQLGLILYELLTLHRAFPHETLTGALEDIRNSRFKSPRRVNPNVPKDLESICLTATEPDVNRRYPSAAELGADLDRFLGGHALKYRPPSPLRRAGLYARRNRKPLLVGLAALILGGCTAWWVFGGDAWQLSPPEPFVIRGPDMKFLPTFVRDGDILGLEIELAEETFLYALSVCGQNAAQRRPQDVQPVAPYLVEELRAALAAERLPVPAPAGLPAGKHLICLSQIEARAVRGERSWDEGLLVFCSRKPSDLLGRWIKVLEEKSKALASDAPGIPYADAVEALVTVTRGSGIDLRKTQREQLRRALESGRPAQSGLWPFDDPRPLSVYLPLRR